MKLVCKPVYLLAAVLMLAAAPSLAAKTECEVRCVASMPGASSSHAGVSGAFVGVSGHTVIIAGGSDFPDLKPWEGGHKKYYDTVYTLALHDGEYVCEVSDARLPVPLAGGCAASDGRTVYCFGGRNDEVASDKVYAISLDGGEVNVSEISTLPDGFVPASAVYYKEGGIFVHGTAYGQNAMYRYSIPSGKWHAGPGCPDRTISEGCSFVYQHNGLSGGADKVSGEFIGVEYLPVVEYAFEIEGVIAVGIFGVVRGDRVIVDHVRAEPIVYRRYFL